MHRKGSQLKEKDWDDAKAKDCLYMRRAVGEF